MDPLSALGVAASVVQFVDFAGKIVFKARDIYKSSQGSLQENDQTETVTKRLQEMANQLNNAVHQSNAHLATGGSSNEPRSFAVRISDVCKECIEVSKELLSKLGNLKVPKDSQHRRWKSFRQALKSVCSKHEVEALAKRLRCLKGKFYRMFSGLVFTENSQAKLEYRIIAERSAFQNPQQQNSKYR
jgi:cytochrome c-type biogenesis protein CcmH/NrfF